MLKSDKLSEYYKKDIKKEDFKNSNLSLNGDAVIKLEFRARDYTVFNKEGWTLDGARLLDLDTHQYLPPIQPSHPQPQYPPQPQNPPQPQYPPQQPQYPPQQPVYPPQQQGNPPQQQYSGYPPYQGFPPQQYPPQPQFGFRYEIIDMKNKYGMNIPEEQIDQTIEEAKNKKRKYAFPEKESNYIRYDEKGKSYIASTHGFSFAHSDNKDCFDEKNDPNSYDGNAKHLKQVTWLSINYKFNHVKPGNYKLYLNQCFENKDIKGKITFKIFVCDKQILEDKEFPNDDMVKIDKLSEYYIRDIKKEDFDMNKLDQNGDAIIRIEFVGNIKKHGKEDGQWMVQNF